MNYLLIKYLFIFIIKSYFIQFIVRFENFRISRTEGILLGYLDYNNFEDIKCRNWSFLVFSIISKDLHYV